MLRKNKLKDMECFVFDVDGTLSLGNTPLRGAKELIAFLVNRGTAHYFFTNNSSKNPEDYVKKLDGMGIQNDGIKSIITSGDVTAAYMLEKERRPKVFVCGTDALKRQFSGKEIDVVEEPGQKIDFAVLGFDTELSYKKLRILTDYICEGVPYLATNIDDVCPLEDGKFLIDCGSMAKMIENATGQRPKFLGKPEKETVEYIISRSKKRSDKIALVGDRLYTDIMTAYNGGMVSVGVLTGEMTEEDIEKSDIKPDFLFKSVYEILCELKEEEK